MLRHRAVKEKLAGFAGWGAVQFDTAEQIFEVGPLRLGVVHVGNEWVLRWEYAEDPLLNLARLSLETFEWGERVNLARFAMSRSGTTLRIYPSLADRGVVVRPETPTWLGPQDEVAFFVSTPMWLCVESENRVPLLEIPTYRPSDTWFGDFQDGELAYAGRTAGRTSVEQVSVWRARIWTRVEIRNVTDEPLLIERINIPVPLLTLYQDVSERFWTEDISLVAAGRGNMGQLRLSSSPSEAKKAERVTLPRFESNSNVLVRALHRLLG